MFSPHVFFQQHLGSCNIFQQRNLISSQIPFIFWPKCQICIFWNFQKDSAKLWIINGFTLPANKHWWNLPRGTCLGWLVGRLQRQKKKTNYNKNNKKKILLVMHPHGGRERMCEKQGQKKWLNSRIWTKGQAILHTNTRILRQIFSSDGGKNLRKKRAISGFNEQTINHILSKWERIWLIPQKSDFYSKKQGWLSRKRIFFQKKTADNHENKKGIKLIPLFFEINGSMSTSRWKIF